MKTKAIRFYGKKDIRLEEFELPQIREDEILAHVVSDSICMSTHKAVEQGTEHKRVPTDIAEKPVILGHEFAGTIVEVGKKWRNEFSPGDKFSIQPALNYKGSLAAPGYSYQYIGGNATDIIIPNEVMECRCLLTYRGEGFFPASLSEPMSCIVGAFNASYHTSPGSYIHQMGIKRDGAMALLAGAGPMGLEAIDYALHNKLLSTADGELRPHNGERLHPSLLVVTDIDKQRLAWAKSIFPPEEAEKQGIRLIYLNTRGLTPDECKTQMLSYTDAGGFDDVFVFAPIESLVELGDAILNPHGCLNFFAGPTTPDFRARLNFYNIHYGSTHVVGTSGGNTDDMITALRLMEQKLITPAVMLTHIGGMDAAVDTILNLPNIPGGKKLIYTNIRMELTAISDFNHLQHKNPLFGELYRITEKNYGLWSTEAEAYLLSHAEKI